MMKRVFGYFRTQFWYSCWFITELEISKDVCVFQNLVLVMLLVFYITGQR